jgi:hypothetical protein
MASRPAPDSTSSMCRTPWSGRRWRRFLRFIPYVGPVLGAGAPILVSLAADEGWARPLYVVGLFVGLELFTNLVLETVLYAGAAGVSAVALLASVAFWTWLWGPLGLVLATPLTVCLVVLGKHVPGLEFPRHALVRHARDSRRSMAITAPVGPRSERGGRSNRALHQDRVSRARCTTPCCCLRSTTRSATAWSGACHPTKETGRRRRDAGAPVGRRGVDPGPQL